MVEHPEDSFRIQRVAPYLLGSLAAAVVEARTSGRDVIDLSQVNPDLGPPAAALEQLVQACLLPHNHRYSASQGITKLRRCAAEWYGRRFGVDLDYQHEVAVTMGTKEGLSHLLFAVTTPGDNILVPTPTYPIHASAVFLAGAGFIGVALGTCDAEEGAALNGSSESFFERLQHAYQATWPRPKLMIVSFPHNPTTATVDLGFFERLTAFALENRIFLLHDHAYADLCFDGYRAPSLLQAPRALEVGAEFYSLSKSFNIPGWRVGFCVGNQRLVAALKKIKSYLDFGIFQPLQIAAVSILQNSEAILEETVSTLQARRDVLCAGLEQLGWTIGCPAGSYPRATSFVWARIPQAFAGLGSLSFCHRLLGTADVAVSPGIGFYGGSDHYIRFALVENEQRLRSALRRIEQSFSRGLQ